MHTQCGNHEKSWKDEIERLQKNAWTSSSTRHLLVRPMKKKKDSHPPSHRRVRCFCF
ncbi:hypothetical protein M569_11973 [Genlisea aurea]|uniref:Uncharacterized protein n=1 Tax=Genlisea aurea TaxID=192259 RepID=S8C7Q2_9LAMI|nr:hypothetical protein M569_11973 [Genlisea aurea]